jgi:SAM-dependent methyltransferase
MANTNQLRFSAPEVVDSYTKREQLEPAERAICDKYITSSMRILDVGVGGGRTTAFLSSIARDYVGIDYVQEMIDVCRRRFPGVTFITADASDLSGFAEMSFDAINFSFNGIDFFESNAGRHRFLQHAARVLTAGGLLIFSSHNAHCLWPNGFRGLVHNRGHVWRMIRTRVLLRGEGYVLEPTHGGLRTHYATREKVRQELAQFGFKVLEILPHDFPSTPSRFSVPWYHYVSIRTSRNS